MEVKFKAYVAKLDRPHAPSQLSEFFFFFFRKTRQQYVQEQIFSRAALTGDGADRQDLPTSCFALCMKTTRHPGGGRIHQTRERVVTKTIHL